jgi:hypothetical protein
MSPKFVWRAQTGVGDLGTLKARLDLIGGKTGEYDGNDSV